MKKTFVLMFFLIVSSCDRKKSNEYEGIYKQNNLLDIKFTSLFDCGIFDRFVLNNKGNSFSKEYSFLRKYTLYNITSKDCIYDTIKTNITIAQSDSIINLANKFIRGFTMDNKLTSPRNVVMDGGNFEVMLCIENRCSTSKYMHYGHLESVSTDLALLLKYLDTVIKKGNSAEK